MSASIRLSRKSAQALMDFEPLPQFRIPALERAFNELRAALTPRPKSSLKRKTEKKRRTKGAETKAIYVEVNERAQGRCEAPYCRGGFSMNNRPELDHALPKGRYRQSVRTCWMIHKHCHDAKHAGAPSAEFWWEQFITHCELHGYQAEAETARAKLEAEQLLQAAESVGCP